MYFKKIHCSLCLGGTNDGCYEGIRASGGGQPCLWFSQVHLICCIVFWLSNGVVDFEFDFCCAFFWLLTSNLPSRCLACASYYLAQGCTIGCKTCTGIGSHSSVSLCNSTMQPTLPKEVKGPIRVGRNDYFYFYVFLRGQYKLDICIFLLCVHRNVDL